ncbi:ATP-binding protein [Streptomyces glaucosporus]|uniref:ATP-binding protein n=1 Tax=Streptomyces glaucosporus TaxID=284044 RepID=A0ABN3ITX8_9ACTN
MLDRLWHAFPPLDADALSGSASRALPPRYEAVRTAREFTRAVLTRWGLAGHFDTVALVVSELVTNALRHGLSGAAPGEPEPPVRLHLVHWSGRLVCAVRDPGKDAPVARAPDFTALAGDCSEEEAAADADTVEELLGRAAESGRGLFLVEAFSDSWGWQPMDDSAPGKIVWALFRLNPGRDTGVSPVRGGRTRRP